MKIHTNLMIYHLRHDLFAELGSIAFDVREELRVLEPLGIELFPEVFELLVELEGPGKGLLSNALIAVDDFAREDGEAVEEDEGGEIGA